MTRWNALPRTRWALLALALCTGAALAQTAGGPRFQATASDSDAAAAAALAEGATFTFDSLAGGGDSLSAATDSGGNGVGVQPGAAGEGFGWSPTSPSEAGFNGSVSFVGVAFPADMALWTVEPSSYVGAAQASSGSAGSIGISGAYGAEGLGVLRTVDPEELVAMETPLAFANAELAPVPEPAAAVLLVAGLGLLALRRRG